MRAGLELATAGGTGAFRINSSFTRRWPFDTVIQSRRAGLVVIRRLLDIEMRGWG